MDKPDATLSLADAVSVCIVDRHAVFLDLGRDEYSAVTLHSALDLDESPSPAVENFLQQQLAQHRAHLEEAGLISHKHTGGSRLAEFLSIPSVRGHILGRDDSRSFGYPRQRADQVKLGALDAVQFFLACWKASRLLKTCHISSIADRVRSRKRRVSGRVNEDELRRQLLVFRRLRPWYPRSYLCLWEALALVEFLARRRLFPDWIFGVQVEPFGAHCWLQADDKALNEDTEYALQFTPILSI